VAGSETRSTPSEDELLRILVDKISSMVAYWDASLRCRFANRAYERWFGISPEALVGKHIKDLLGPLYEKNLPFIERALRGEPQEFEREIPDPAGGPSRYSLANYIPHVVGGVVRGFFAVVTDISAVKRSEFARRESEERFRLVLDEAPIGMALVAPDGRFVRVNRALCDIVGYTAEELEGLTFQAITHPDDLDADLALAGQLARGEIPRYQLEKRYLHKSGAVVDIMLSGSVLRDHDGSPLYFIAQIEDVTERKRLTESLRLAQAKSSGILAISADAIISVDEQQNITLFNDGAQAIFGYSEEEAIGAPLDILIPERFRARHRQHVAAFASGDQAARRMSKRVAAIFGLRKNGEEFPADATISKLVVAGQVLLNVALRDISEQKRAEDLIRQSQQRFELALEGADLGSWDWNIKTGSVIFNARWAEMRGYALAEIEPHVSSWSSGVHPEDLPRVELALEEHFSGRSSYYETEHRVRTKDGKWIWVLDRGKIFARGADGEPVRMVGTELDVTARRRAQDTSTFLAEVGHILASSLRVEDTLGRIARVSLRSLADCVIVDVVGEGEALRRVVVVHADPAKRELCEQLKHFRLDWRRPYLASKMLSTGRPALMSDVDPEYVVSVAQNEEHLKVLRELDPKSMMAVPLQGRHGQLGTVLFIATDPMHRYGEEDLALADDLARRAALALENAQLYETARRATQLRDDVLGIVAHDLRNPLGTILMQATTLGRREASGPPPKKSLEMIERAAKRMSRLIQDLLDVTRMEAGQLGVERSVIGTRAFVTECTEAQALLSAAAALELELELDADLPEVWADRDRLLQVFENLIGNAVKFTRPGGRIAVGAKARDREVLFWVRDTGAGIAPEDVQHLFDRFWQARKGTKRGAGLGLPIVKGIVEAHGGRIWVESTVGQGSTFFFTIPTQRTPAVRAESPEHARPVR
jgi:PAS domain S-box-containing protein